MQKLLLVNIIQKIAPQAKSGKHFQIWFFPRFGGKKWRRSEHAHASYPGLFFRPPGFSPYMGREERRVQGLDYVRPGSYVRISAVSNAIETIDNETVLLHYLLFELHSTRQKCNVWTWPKVPIDVMKSKEHIKRHMTGPFKQKTKTNIKTVCASPPWMD